MKKTIYTLEELAQDFDLTERTARYYIENVLPPHHKKGRGKKAEYGQDTWNCFAFIQLAREQHGLRPGQVAGVLAEISQSTIDRVVSGEEQLAVRTVSTTAPSLENMPSASARAKRYMAKETGSSFALRPSKLSSASISKDHSMELDSLKTRLRESRLPNEWTSEWQTVYRDDQVKIACQVDGELDDHQEEQIRTAAKLIRLALRR